MRTAIFVALLVSAAACRGRSVSYPDPVYDDAGSVRSDAGDGGDGADPTIEVTDASVDNPAALADGRCALGAFKRDGICSCQGSVPDVCGEACTDLSGDDANCGVCGHACGPTSPCVAGACRPAPETIVAAAPGCVALDLATSGDALYWADAGHGAIMRLAPGAAPTVVAAGEEAPRTIVVRGTSVFWLGGGGKQLRRAAPGEAPVTVTTSATDIHGLVATDDAAMVYYSVGPDVMRVAAAGGPSTNVVHIARALPGTLALDGDRLGLLEAESDYVWVATLSEGHVSRCGQVTLDDVVDESCKNLARGAPKFREQLAMPPGQLVWAYVNDGVVSGPSDPPGPPDNYRIGSVTWTLTGLAATSTFVYFSESGFEAGKGIVYAGPLARDAHEQARLARNQNAPRAVTVGGDRVYWSTGDCAIMAAKL